MYHPFQTASVILSLIASSGLSGPKIEFDTKSFDCGTVIEGKTEKLDAAFIVRNTGNAVLKLESVRPGCGCTVVKYDSLIQPGKSAKIESQVRIKGYRAGQLLKSITVTSNAENEQTVRLTIKATIRAIVGISENYLDLVVSHTTVPKTIFLTSTKEDLNVSSISFKSDEKAGAPVWQQNLKLNIKFTFTPTDSLTPDSSRVFKLNIYQPELTEIISGEFIITTNHKEKQEILLRGKIGK